MIEATKMNAHFQVDRACQSILQRWLEGATLNVDPKLHVTWETLLGCLEDVGMNTLAENLRSELLPWPKWCCRIWNGVAEFAVFTGSIVDNGSVKRVYSFYGSVVGVASFSGPSPHLLFFFFFFFITLQNAKTRSREDLNMKLRRNSFLCFECCIAQLGYNLILRPSFTLWEGLGMRLS